MKDTVSFLKQLEQYTLLRPQEVLLLTVDVLGDPDEILIFRGFSSSLMAPTAADPDTPVLSSEAVISRIDRLKSPYQPANPEYLAQGLTLDEFEQYLRQLD